MNVLSNDLKIMATNYDKVILDLGAGVERTVQHLTNGAGSVIVVINDDMSS